MFEKYFITVKRGKRIEEGCAKLVNILKEAGKPMSLREIYDKASSIYLTQSMLDTLVRCKALTKEIRAEEVIDKPFEKTILKNISFDFEQGKNYVITGANGCGKSTLAKIIMGIIKPTSGKIVFDGKDITNLDITDRARLGIAFAMQQPIRFKGMSIQKLLEYASNSKLNPSSACDYLSMVGLCARDYLQRELDSTLSGGELKRIEIASVLARNAKLNIYDEPEAGIDIWSFNGLVNIFKKSLNENNLNIIISHQEKLFNSADEIILIANGKIETSGCPEKVLQVINGYNTCKRLGVE